MRESLALLKSAVDDRWESVAQVLDEHGGKDLGDGREGTALWHLRHLCEILRLHVRVASGGELKTDVPVPDSPPEIVVETRRSLLAFIAWADAQPPHRWTAQFDYGRPIDLHEMIGVMLRHLVWHAAAVHYWVKWRGRAG